MKHLNWILCLVLITCMGLSAKAQSWRDSIDVKVYGYVKLDAFYDTRETVNGREGHFLLWPAPPDYDAEGVDRAQHGSFNMLAVQTNLGVKVQGPKVLNAETMAKVEGDFFGQRNDNINLIRLRHAFFQMKWKSTDLLIGQYWNPVFNLGAFPHTVSFTTGTPILPFSRNPQVRVTQHFGNFALMGIVQSQRDYPSYGPNPDNPNLSIANSSFLKNSGLPEFHAKLTYDYKKNSMFLKAGAGAGYKRIMPRTITDNGYVTDVTVPGISATAYVNFGYSGWNLKGGAIYGNNATDVMSIGGFAVSNVIDTAKNFYEYTTLSSYSVWMDMSQQVKSFNIGVFAGYVEHLGAEKDIVGNTWGLGNNIAYIYRLAPRITWQNKNFRLSFEVEHTAAAFGTANEKGVPVNTEEVSNTRFLLGAYYFFN